MTCRNEARVLEESGSSQLREVDADFSARTESSATSGQPGAAVPHLLMPVTAVRIAVRSAAKLRGLDANVMRESGPIADHSELANSLRVITCAYRAIVNAGIGAS